MLSPAARPATPLSARLTFLIVGTVLAMLGLVALFAVSASNAVDQEALQRQANFVRSGISEIRNRLPKEQESAAVWDEAVMRTRAGDQAWMQDNLGEWMGSYFGHDSNYVLNERNAPIHAVRDLTTLPPEAYTDESHVIIPLVERLRAQMAVASEGLADSTEAVTDLHAKDFVMLGGTPAIVSVKPIVPNLTLVQAPGTEYLHVAVRRVSDGFLSEIARKYDLRNVRLLAVGEVGDSGTAVPIISENGKVLGMVAWMGDRPGLRMLREIAPGIIAATGGGMLLLLWLAMKLRRYSIELQASEAQAQFLAFHDTLTGLPNRALFEDRLDRALVASRRPGGLVALHAIDIDRFKNINDTLGHPAGDELIRQVAARLSKVTRDTDTVARLGGDEFAIVQTEIERPHDADRVAERLLEVLSAPFDLMGETAFVSASIGLALTNATDATRDELFRKADIALYEAKSRGRGRYETFAGDMDDVVKRRRLIERELRTALETDTQLSILYQPLFSADGLTIRGAEALVRWNHPVHGLLSPELFIGIAEERALIEPLGEWVLREACALAVRIDLPWVAVNVSPVQFRSERFTQRVIEVLAQTGLAPKRLQLEITEGVLIENTELITASLKRLRDVGVRIALDDFGTGYSSMSYLRNYAVDKLKIDRSFVSQLGTSADSDAIVRAMIGLARALRLEVTAEGVETDEQRDHLAAIGCHELQGYLLSRPIGEAEIAALLQATAGQRPEEMVARVAAAS